MFYFFQSNYSLKSNHSLVYVFMEQSTAILEYLSTIRSKRPKKDKKDKKDTKDKKVKKERDPRYIEPKYVKQRGKRPRVQTTRSVNVQPDKTPQPSFNISDVYSKLLNDLQKQNLSRSIFAPPISQTHVGPLQPLQPLQQVRPQPTRQPQILTMEQLAREIKQDSRDVLQEMKYPDPSFKGIETHPDHKPVLKRLAAVGMTTAEKKKAHKVYLDFGDDTFSDIRMLVEEHPEIFESEQKSIIAERNRLKRLGPENPQEQEQEQGGFLKNLVGLTSGFR